MEEIFYLVLNGKLPVAAVDQTLLPPWSAAIFRAVEYLGSRGHLPPYPLKDVQKLAIHRFRASKEAVEFLKEFKSYTPIQATLESIQQQLLLQRVVQRATEQLATGGYDLLEISRLLDASSPVEECIKPVKPVRVEEKTYLLKTGISTLDDVIGGVNAELVIVSARPKAGKSNFFWNVIQRNPDVKTVYITVADYDYTDLCELLTILDPAITERKNLWIADLTMFSATVLDVENVIQSLRPECVIVDRAEKLTPLRKRKEARQELGEIFDTLRRFAKKYSVPVFVDSQLSASGTEYEQKKEITSPDYMAEDRTNRYAILDLFIGLRRKSHGVVLTLYGRRKGLPRTVEIPTDLVGRYLDIPV